MRRSKDDPYRLGWQVCVCTLSKALDPINEKKKKEEEKRKEKKMHRSE